MTKETIMIIGAAQEHCLGINVAHRMGMRVFVTDGNPRSPGFALAEAFSVASTYDPKATLDAAKNYIENGGRIDGVMTLAADVPYTVAYVAEHLGLAGIGLETALNASEKIRMKECFLQRSLPMPLFREVANEEHLMQVADEFGLPIVVKPVDSRGARGVQLIRERTLLPAAYSNARQYSPTDRVMIEEYLPGPQLSTEGFMLDGEAYVPAIFDRNYEYLDRFAPFVVENGGEMPSLYEPRIRDEINSVMKQAALALGMETGVIKGDLVVSQGQVKVIEIAARLSGGFFGTVATPASCGVDLVRTNIEVSLGRSVDPHQLDHKYERAAAIRFAFPESGRVIHVDGLSEILQDESCCYAHVFVNEGDVIPTITNHPGRPAVVVADGDTREDAVINANRLINSLCWQIEQI